MGANIQKHLARIFFFWICLKLLCASTRVKDSPIPNKTEKKVRLAEKWPLNGPKKDFLNGLKFKTIDFWFKGILM